MSSNSNNNNAELPGALSSLNIGGDKINNKEKEATDDRNTVAICAACGKEGGDNNMNTCNKCDLVVYCNASCKKKHRPKHKKKCEKRAAELFDEELFKVHPPREECPICMLPLPSAEQVTFYSCCGKNVCNGCIVAMFDREGMNILCAYCRTPPAESGDEEVERLRKRMEKGNPSAYNNLAGHYANGTRGLPQDWAKANELYLKAGDLGSADAYFNLGNSYRVGRGVEVDEKKAKHYWELAATNGHIKARHNLGAIEGQAGNHERAYKHLLISASAGSKKSLDSVKGGFMRGLVTKEQYANTLREYQKSQDEMKSEARDKALAARN